MRLLRKSSFPGRWVSTALGAFSLQKVRVVRDGYMGGMIPALLPA